MGILTNLVGSVTGSIDKALLCVKKPAPATTAPGLINRVMQLNSVSNVDLQARLAVAQGNRRNIVSSFAAVQGIAKTSGYHVIQVKYNPSKIGISAAGGSFMEAGAGGAGTNTLTQVTMPTQTVMRVELVFDDENHPDAFMWEKYTNLTAGALVSDASALAKTVMGRGYSVQAQIEGMIALLSQSETRQVVFYWSDLSYAGEVTSVDAKYTMFNPQGNPIRGNVTLSIQQGGEDATGEYWDKAFEKLFVSTQSKAAAAMGSFSNALDSMGNIINRR